MDTIKSVEIGKVVTGDPTWTPERRATRDGFQITVPYTVDPPEGFLEKGVVQYNLTGKDVDTGLDVVINGLSFKSQNKQIKEVIFEK